MKNAALAIDYLHSLRHGWDPLAIEFHHETLFGEGDAAEVEGDTAERSLAITRLALLSRSAPASKSIDSPAGVLAIAMSRSSRVRTAVSRSTTKRAISSCVARA
jgi:hypothetical protein